MAQLITVPISSFATPSANTDYCVATISAPTGVPCKIIEVTLCPEGIISTDGSFRYKVGIASGPGTPGTAITVAQNNPSLTLPSAITPTATQWGSGTPSTLTTSQDTVSVPATAPYYRDFRAKDMHIKEGTSFCVIANILGSTNTNIKFSGYVLLEV